MEAVLRGEIFCNATYDVLHICVNGPFGCARFVGVDIFPTVFEDLLDSIFYVVVGLMKSAVMFGSPRGIGGRRGRFGFVILLHPCLLFFAKGLDGTGGQNKSTPFSRQRKRY